MYIFLPSVGCLGLGGVRKVEAAPSLRNKIRQSFLYLVDLRPGSNDGLGGCLLAGASDLGGLGLLVPANRHGIFFRGGVSGGRRRGCAEVSFGFYDGFPDFAGGAGFGKLYEFVCSGDLLSLERFELVFCPSLFFFVVGGRYVYQLEVPGWVMYPCLGGSAPLQGSSSSGGLEFLAVLEASGSSTSDDVLAFGHLQLPDRSTIIMHVVFDVRLKTATTNFGTSPGRRPDSGCGFWSPVARKTGRWLQGLVCNSCFYRGCLCNMGCNLQVY